MIENSDVAGRLLYFMRETVNNALIEADKKFVFPLILGNLKNGDRSLSSVVPFGLIDWDKCKTTVEAQIKEKCYSALFEDQNVNNLLKSKTKVKYKYLIYILRYIFVKDMKHSLELDKILCPRVFATSLNRCAQEPAFLPTLKNPIGIKIEINYDCLENCCIRFSLQIEFYELKEKNPHFRVFASSYEKKEYFTKNFTKSITCNFRTLCKYFLLHKVHFVFDIILKLFNCLKRKCLG